MAAAVVMIKPERQPAAALVARRALQFRDQEMALAELRTDGPAGLRIAVDGVLRAVVKLRPVRGGPGKNEIRFRRARAGLGHGAHREFVEDEVPARAPPSGSILRQARIGQDLEQHSGDAGQVNVRVHGNGVIDGIHAEPKQRTIREIGVARSAVGEGIGQVQHAPDIAPFRDELLPLLLLSGKILPGGSQAKLRELESVADVTQRVAQVRLGHFNRGRDVVVASVGGVVEEGVELIILVVRNRIVFVRVAFSAIQCEAKPRGAHRRDAILHRLHAILFFIATALVVQLGVAVEAGGDLLGQRWLRQEIAGELIDGELVEGLVPVEGIDDPFTVRPDGTRQIHLIAVGVGVARQIQPAPCHVLAVVRRREQSVHQLFVGLRRRVLHERLHLVPA